MAERALEAQRSHPGSRSGLFSVLLRLIQIKRQRNTLKALESWQLDDIGLSAAEREAEVKKPLWDVPAHWR